MEWLNSIPESLRAFAIPAFVIGAALYAGWSSRRGAREAKGKSQEFAFAGQLADMGPVKELVELLGLLTQQQVRTNIVLERLATDYEGQIKAEAVEQEIASEVDRRVDQQLREQRRRQRRSPPRAKAGG